MCSNILTSSLSQSLPIPSMWPPTHSTILYTDLIMTYLFSGPVVLAGHKTYHSPVFQPTFLAISANIPYP